MASRLYHPQVIDKLFETIVQDRRWLHAHPELSNEEKETAAYLTEQLRKIGLSPEGGIGGHGIRVVIEGQQSGPVIALRADMDALPIQEETDLPFASTRPGVMHACGHDVHMAVLLGTARVLAASDRPWAGKVVLIFQPAEERGPGGARAMIEDGVLTNPDVDAIFALHVNPFGPAGTLEFGAGPITASSDGFKIVVKGISGHAAAPHEAIDPIPAAAQIVSSLQHVISRRIPPTTPAVVTVGQIHGGHADNIIADEVRLSGTMRTIDPDVRNRLHELVETTAKDVASAHGCSVDIRLSKGYPPIVNDPRQTEIARQAARGFLPDDKIGTIPPRLVAEDFAYYLNRVPGSMARLGVAPPGDDELYPVHNSKLKVDENALRTGVAYFLSLIETWFDANS